MKQQDVPQFANPFTWGDMAELPTSAWLGHIPFARWLVNEMRPKTVVELGTHQGTSFFAFCQAVKELDLRARVSAVDTWEGDQHAGFYGDEIFQDVAKVVEAHYPSIGCLHRTTFDAARSDFGDASVDILHIDGLHTYEAVRHDYQSWHETVRTGGVILFHDITVRTGDFGVWKLWEELRDQSPSFEFHHSHGLGVLGVGEGFSENLSALLNLDREGEAASHVRRQFEIPGERLELVQEKELLNARIELLKAELDGLRKSKSWYITTPLRKGETILREVFGRTR